MQKIVLIPSYEPDNKLRDLVVELHQYEFEIVVVNDGSHKDYQSIFDSIRRISTVLEYSENKGKGYALKYGFHYIQEHYQDYVVVTMDSDGQHTVKDAIKLCNYTMSHPKELVIGKRVRDVNIPLRSRIGNEFTKAIYHITTGVNVYDTQTGLRSFSNQLMDFCLNISGNRYEYEINVLLYAAKEKIKITEIEVETIYIDQNSGSHFQPLKDSLRIYKEIIRFSLSSIISFVIDYLFYVLFIFFTGHAVLSNLLARIISGTVNYTINRYIVFKSNRSKSFIRYVLLAITILTFNTLLLRCFLQLGVNRYIAKILVEFILFMFSWLIQRKMIFKKDTD